MLQGPSFIPEQVSRAVVLCHGYGASGDDLFDLRQMLAPDDKTAFVSLDAPTPLPWGGFEWFSLNDYQPNGMHTESYLEILMERVKPSVRMMHEWLADFQKKTGLSADKIVLGGFSQGGLVALLTALTAPDCVAGVMGMSAVPLLLNQDIAVTCRPPVLLTHGTSDSVVPPAALALNRAQLESIGITPRVVVSPGLEHGIDGVCLEQMRLFIAESLKS